MILAFSAYGRVGKDTAADVCVRERGFIQIAFADALREMAGVLNPIIDVRQDRGDPYTFNFVRYNDLLDTIGYHDAKNIPEFRTFLQKLGTEAVRSIVDDNAWVNIVARRIAETPGDYVITDCRFLNEAVGTREMGGAVVRIHRPGYGPLNDHPSETNVDLIDADYEIVNDGTIEDFEQTVLTLVDTLRADEAEAL